MMAPFSWDVTIHCCIEKWVTTIGNVNNRNILYIQHEKKILKKKKKYLLQLCMGIRIWQNIACSSFWYSKNDTFYLYFFGLRKFYHIYQWYKRDGHQWPVLYNPKKCKSLCQHLKKSSNNLAKLHKYTSTKYF